MNKKTASKIEITKCAMKNSLVGVGGWMEADLDGGRWGEWLFYGTRQM